MISRSQTFTSYSFDGFDLSKTSTIKYLSPNLLAIQKYSKTFDSRMTDEQLMLAVKNGKLDSMSILFERYHRRLYNFFFRINYNQNLSEDLSQNVFERVIRYRNSYNPAFSFKTWIFQIARNVRLEHYKKYGQQTMEDIDKQKFLQLEDDTSMNMDKKEQIILLEKAISRLNDEQREILLLTRFQNMKYAEVARLLGCSEGAVKVKVYRTIKQLRQIYLKYL